MIVREITTIVYDTLMENKQHPQLDILKVDNPEVDAIGGLILFDYEGLAIRVSITSRRDGVRL